MQRAEFSLEAVTDGPIVPKSVLDFRPGCIAISLPSGQFLMIPNSESSPDGVHEVSIMNPDGEEAVMWNADEFAEDPVLVLGAMFGAILSGAKLDS